MATKSVKKSVKQPMKPKDVVQQPKPVQKVQAQPQSTSSEVSETTAIICLLLNILILPGLGSLIAHRSKVGIWQLIIAIVSVPLMFVVIGFFGWAAAWIWSLMTGLDIIKKAKKN